MINGTEYAYEDVQIVIEGKSIPLTGVKSIEYGSAKAQSNIYGRSNKPVAMGRGKKEHKEGTLVIYQSELEAMQRAMPPGKDILDRDPFSITVSYAPEGGVAISDKLLGCRFSDLPKGLGTDDTHMEVPLKFLPFNIQYGAL